MKIAILDARRAPASAAICAVLVLSGALFGGTAAQDKPPAAPAPGQTVSGEQKTGGKLSGEKGHDNKPPEREAPARPFKGVMFSETITRAEREPVFIDLDTHRWMTPPPDLLVPENKGKSIDQWVFPTSLHLWIHRSGIDLALQTDGRSLTVLGFDLRTGDSFPANDRKSEAAIADSVTPAPADPSQWITLKLHIVRETIFRRTPFVTREGGLGTFCFHVSGVLGPNTIRVDHELAREPDVPKLTGQPVDNVYEPPILSTRPPDLLVDVSNSKLRLRVPGGPSQIELGADQVIVGEVSKPELRATRLHTGRLEIDAGTGEVVVHGSSRATLRRVGDRVEIAYNKRTRGRLERNPDKRVAEAPQFTFLMSRMKVAQEDSFEWTTVKPSPELVKKQADERRKRYEAGEALYAELAAKFGYSLAPGEFFKRIPPPFPEPRDEYWRVTRPDQFFYLGSRGGAGPDSIAYLWDGKTLHEGTVSFGAAQSLIGVCDTILKLKPQQISGPQSLLITPLPGDWVIRQGTIADDVFVHQLEPILRNELKLPIHLEFRDVPREVYVARGTWHMTPLADTRVRTGAVQIYGKALNFGTFSAGGGQGDFTEFLKWVGRWIDAPIVSEVTNPPKHLSWTLHGPPNAFGRGSTDAEQRAAHDPALVLHNVEAQTDLHFTKETRPIKLLFVEEKPL